MAAAAADRNLLFGLLALQNDLIDRDQLVDAFRAWSRDKARPLAEHLGERGDLDSEQRAAVVGPRRAARQEAWRRPGEKPGIPSGRPLHSPESRRCRRLGSQRHVGSHHVGPHPEWRSRPYNDSLRRRRHLPWRAVPDPAAPCARRLGRGLRGTRRRAKPRGRPQADPRQTCRRSRPAAPGSCSRPRSPAAWNIQVSCRCTAWEPIRTDAPITRCGSSEATASRRPSLRSIPTRV